MMSLNMGFFNFSLNVHLQFTVVLIMILRMSFCGGYTDPRDVFAINSLYAALGSPEIPGWVALGGDPCMEAWQGVLCVNSNITGISLNNANLRGELGTSLDSFTAIISINLIGNHIGGTIPANLPPTMKTLFLSDNQFTGGIPDLSVLSQLTELDLAENNMSGSLPPSMGNLSSLTTLHLQNNQFTGLLTAIQDLPLNELNVENNQFSGPIPPRLLTIPNFRGTGNQFNTSVVSSPPALVPPTNSSLPGRVPSQEAHKKPQDNPSVPGASNLKSTNYIKPIVSAAVAVLILLTIILGVWFCIIKWCKKRQTSVKFPNENPNTSHEKKAEKPKYNDFLPQTHNQVLFQETSLKVLNVKNMDQKQMKDDHEVAPFPNMSKDAHSIEMTETTVNSISSTPVPPPRHYSNEKITLKPIVSTVVTKTEMSAFPSSVKSFTIASLQQYTDSFSEENLTGEGMIGSVYRAELPDGKLLAVKKLNSAICGQQSEDEFAKLITNLSNIQHENIVKLIGYCAEYEQRLIIYEYCNNTTLYDALHHDTLGKLPWNARIKIALGAAKALEYMHEVCRLPVVHMNFSSANILLDDKFDPLISDCGLAPLLSDTYICQVAGGYGAPELELGTYTYQSDVFSFGVVMLELVTGRKPYDSTRPRAEQFLVRWAIPQLHDIDALAKMVDPSLHGSYSSKSLSGFADIISLCVQAEPEFRPPASEIADYLLSLIQKLDQKFI